MISSLTVITGTIIYAFIKLAGYSLFAKYLNKIFSKENNIWKVGLVRTALGVGLGLIHNGIFFSFFNISMGRSPIGGDGTYLFFTMLILLRIVEWGLIIHWFYNKNLTLRAISIKAICLGIVWSFILDIPSMTGLFLVIASIC